MSPNIDRQRFKNEELLLKVSSSVNRTKWDESRYEAFIDELCGSREYQKDSIRIALRYLLGCEHKNLRLLAKANFDENHVLDQRYGSWEGMERHLQLPDQLSASLDLATGTGKSYVIYGIAAILLAEDAVDRVLVLCPSTTIETGLMEKFTSLAGNGALKKLLPANSKIASPRIINASETITEGSICIENYHAVLEHVGSSIRASLEGKGARVAVFNDECHHVANESDMRVKKWKEFLTNPAYGFRIVIGVSGTCYVGDDYFADVIYRYSLRQAIEERYVKKVEYVAEMPIKNDSDEKWQLIRNRHEDIKHKLKSRRMVPLSIIVTSTIQKCKDVVEELKAFLIEHDRIKLDIADKKVLMVYNNAPDLAKLQGVDNQASKIEWIVAVSMLNEGWDVKRVFQIVPHEERAFNSKLLIAQVLGRGLRIPEKWTGSQPVVTVFNHDAWASRIRHLVNEILEIEKRISTHVIDNSLYHFDLHQVDYTLDTISVKKQMAGDYVLLAKGYVDLATDTVAEEVSVDFEDASTGEHQKWQTKITHKTYTPREIAQAMYERLQDADESDDSNKKSTTSYAEQFPVSRLSEIVKKSLKLLNTSVATESMKQKFLQSLGTLYRKESEYVRYVPKVNQYTTVSTKERQADSVSAAELRNTKTLYCTDQTKDTLKDEQIDFFIEVIEPGNGYKCVIIPNRNDLKSPVNAVIADHENERKFIKMLLEPNNSSCYDTWLKSTSTRFYEIDYAWKKGEHPKRGKFSPDFFIKLKDFILVIEIKGDEELQEPSEENKKKFEYSFNHFQRINKHLEKDGLNLRYGFHFLSECNFSTFFQELREGRISLFRSELDVKLSEEER